MKSKIISSAIVIMSLTLIMIILSRIKAVPPIWEFELTCLKRSVSSSIFDDIGLAWHSLCNMELISSVQYNAMIVLSLLMLVMYVLIYIVNIGRWFNSISMFVQLFLLIPLIQMSICLSINLQDELILMLLSSILIAALGTLFILAAPLAIIPCFYNTMRRACVAFIIVFSTQLKQQIIIYGTLDALIQLEQLTFLVILFEIFIELLELCERGFRYARVRRNAEDIQ